MTTVPEISNAASLLNLRINKNASFSFLLTWKTKATQTSPATPINNNGYSALMQFRSTPSSQEILFEASDRNGKVKLHGANGIIEVALSAKDTQNMVFSTAYYDMVMRAPDGSIRRLVEGSVVLLEGVSVFRE